jgi:integrase
MTTARKSRNCRYDPPSFAPLPSDNPSREPGTPAVARVNTAMLTLQDLIDGFLRELTVLVRAGSQEPATLRWYRDGFRHFAPLAELPADAVRTHHLAEIAMTNHVVRVIKRLYKWGVAEGTVAKDPFTRLSAPPCGQRERTVSRAELRRLYRAAPRAFRKLLFVQVRTLARPGEIRLLTWGQIDWARRVIVLEEFKGKKRRADKLRYRAIAIPKNVYRLLRNLHRKSPDPSPAGRVFISTRGAKPWSYNGVRCAMRTARVRAGLMDGEERVVCYTLRHTSATEAIRKDISLKRVAEVMGHARTTTTERYLHLKTDDLVETIDRLTARCSRVASPVTA